MKGQIDKYKIRLQDGYIDRQMARQKDIFVPRFVGVDMIKYINIRLQMHFIHLEPE